jgi:NAD(P)-dependent dehydrogenase (short-subunit alcohol dehydrogenase family)
MLLAKGFADRRNNIGPGSAMVFLTSTAAVTSPRATLAYASAKNALLAAAKCASRELASQGIRVNSIAPALVDTPMGKGTAEAMGEESFAKEQAHYPFGMGRPEDVAALACFLLSGEARWITGQNIVMDGGRY